MLMPLTGTAFTSMIPRPLYRPRMPSSRTTTAVCVCVCVRERERERVRERRVGGEEREIESKREFNALPHRHNHKPRHNVVDI